MSKEELNHRQIQALKDIAAHTRTPTLARIGYSKFWTPKTNQVLFKMGLVDFVCTSVIVTDKGLDWLNTRAGEQHDNN